MTAEDTDEQLAAKVQQGDVQLFGTLVRRYEVAILRYVRRFLFGFDDAEDIVQQVFIKAFRHLQSFDVTRKFSTWLYRIAHNEAINALKKKKRQPLRLFDFDTLLPHPVVKERADQKVDDTLVRANIDACIQQLQVKYREVLVLYFEQELSYQEISEVLRIPVSTVGVRLTRAKQAIKKLIEQGPGGPGHGVAPVSSSVPQSL